MTGPLGRRLRHYASEVACYGREARSPRDFVQLMRARLSLSKVGRFACPRPTLVEPNLRSFGGPVTLRSHTTDISVLKELLLGHSYEDVAERAKGDVATILDLGANTGLAARWFAHRFRRARVVSVEPEAGNVSVLRRNLRQLGDRAEVVAAAIGASARSVTLRTSAGACGFRMSELSAADGGDVVDVVPIAGLLAERGLDRIDVLKCDIEGAERELFGIAAAWLDRVRFGVVECHDGYTAADLVADAARGGVIVACWASVG